eukprot:m.418926 g.418926  ORF g.418926 m.418926 type:complete len:51 (-) comp21294_c1_seq10:3585-3737(-)
MSLESGQLVQAPVVHRKSHLALLSQHILIFTCACSQLFSVVHHARRGNSN